MLELGVIGRVAKPLQKRTVGTTNIKDVYAGENHIWPVRNDEVYFYDFDSIQMRYIWGTNDGRDLDTGTCYVNAPNVNTYGDINGKRVGWNLSNPNYLKNGPYMYWGGDNTSSGAECVMVNISAIKQNATEQFPLELQVQLACNWYGSRNSGNATIECSAYKGGTIVKAYQLTNRESDVDTRGTYLFPDKDGYIDMPLNGEYVRCWYGPTIQSNGNYVRINMVTDKFGNSNTPVTRNISNLPNDEFTIVNGYAIHLENGVIHQYKIWNDQVNIQGTIYNVPLTVSGVQYVMLIDSSNTIYNSAYTTSSPTFGFGFIAGNSEYKGTQTLTCNIHSNDHNPADKIVGYLSYYDNSESGKVMVLNPMV